LHFDGHWHLGDYQFIFAMGINSYQMYPFWFVNLASRIVPWLEFALGTLVILGIGLRWVSSAITALLVVFMVMLARSAILGLDINCGCFGYNSVKPSTELLHDSGLLVLSLLVTAQAFLVRRAQRVAK
jgi:putative oxidoreductase